MTDDEQGEIERSLQGDHEAFEALVRRYQRMIYTLAYRMSGSAADAEDLTQETFIRPHQQLSAFRAEAKFSSWLYRIVVNHCLNWRARATRRDQLHTEWGASHEESRAPENRLAHAVQDALVNRAPKRQQPRLAA